MARWKRQIAHAVADAAHAPRRPRTDESRVRRRYAERLRREVMWSLVLGPLVRPWAAAHMIRLVAAWTVDEARRFGLDPSAPLTRAVLTEALEARLAAVLHPSPGIAGRIRPGVAVGMGQEILWVPWVVRRTLADAIRRLHEVA